MKGTNFQLGVNPRTVLYVSAAKSNLKSSYRNIKNLYLRVENKREMNRGHRLEPRHYKVLSSPGTKQ